MKFSQKRFLLAASLVGLVTAGGISLLVVLRGHSPGGPESGGAASLGTSSELSSPPQTQRQRIGPGTDAWRNPGKQWRLQVKPYAIDYGHAFPPGIKSAEWKPTVVTEYLMVVRVLPLRHRGDRDIARFQFTPAGKAPDHTAGEQYVLDVDVQTGQAVELHSAELRPWDRVRTFGADKYLETQLWFPVDWMIRNTDLAAIPLEKTYLLPSRSASGEPANIFKTVEPTAVHVRGPGGAEKMQPAVRVEWVMRQADAPKEYQNEYRLVQVWVPGEPWWRSFHRYRSGRPELEAFWLGEESEPQTRRKQEKP